jgi:hypothetical protein
MPTVIVAHAGARAAADVTLFDKKLRVAGVDGAARSELNGNVAAASASLTITVCGFDLRRYSASSHVSLPGNHWELIWFKAQKTFTFFFIPVTVKGSFGAGIDYSLTAAAWQAGSFVKGGGSSLAIGLRGSAAVYALVRIEVELSAGIGGVGVGGEGQILRTELQIGLGAASDGAAGYLKLVVTALRLRLYVYAWIDLPFRDRDEARRYIADVSIGGATHTLIDF